MRRAILACLVAALLAGPGHRLSAQRLPEHPFSIAPVYLNGRIMPVDSYARIILKTLSGKTSIDGERATSWFKSLVFDPESTVGDKVFLIDNPAVLEAVGFANPERGRFSFEELTGSLSELGRLAEAATVSDEDDLSQAELGILELYHRVVLYQRLSVAFAYGQREAVFYVSSPELSEFMGLPTPKRSYSYMDIATSTEFLSRTEATIDALSEDSRRELSGLAVAFQRWREVHALVPLPVLSVNEGQSERWLNPWAALDHDGSHATIHQESELLVSARDAFRSGNGDAYHSATEAFVLSVISRSGWANLGRLRLELLINRVAPFDRAMLFYLAGCLLLLASVWVRHRWLARTVSVVIGIGLALHTSGIVARIAITGRPPVTSLYTSFVFVSFLLVLLGFVWYLFRRNQMGLIVAAASGLIFMFLSGTVSNELDSLGVLQAVLDTNFWLTVHVLTIATGYAGCIASGIIGHVYLIENIRRPSNETGLRAIYRALYAFLAGSLVFVFAGTMLGGIWADQSWGRFWGWDPKENGALLIILWCSLLLHAKPARVIDQRGMAVGSVAGIVVVMFSWLGVNLMGVGLHAYGFTSGLTSKLIAFSVVELSFAFVAATVARRREVMARVPLRTFVVSGIQRETHDAATILLKPKKSGFTYEAGMYVTLFLRINGLTYRRPFSISSVASESGELSVTVRKIPDGVASHYLLEKLKPGEKLKLAGPSGSFVLPAISSSQISVENKRHSDNTESDGSNPRLIFLAGGAGIAPIMGLIETALRERRDSDTILMYASRRADEIIFKKRLDDLRRHHPRFRVDHFLSEPPKVRNGYKGRLTRDELSARIDGGTRADAYFVCGSVAFVDDMVRELAASGVRDDQINAERFSPASPTTADAMQEARLAKFDLSGSSLSFKVKSGQTILDAGLSHGLPIRYSCAAGRCGDCLIRVKQGEIFSEGPSVLSKAQTDRGFALACIAYPKEDLEAELPV